MNWGVIAIVVVYLLVTLLLPLHTAEKNMVTSMDCTVGGRQFETLFVFFTLLFTAVGAASIVGYTGWYYQRGLSQFWFVIGVALNYLVYVLYLAPKISEFGFRHGGEIVGDWFCYRYGKGSQFPCSMIIMIGYLTITAFQYMAMVFILVKLTNLSYATNPLITAVIVILHTAYGGLWAVASSNVLQGSITLVGLVILAFCLVSNAGGLNAVSASAPVEHSQSFGYFIPGVAISSAPVSLLGIISWPDMWQQCYVAKDRKTLHKSMIPFLIALPALCGRIMMIIGFSALSLYPGYETPESIPPLMVVDQFNTIVRALFLSALLAVIMGGADMLLPVSSMILHRDIYNWTRPQASERENLRASKISSLVCEVIVMFLAIVAPSMFDLWVTSVDSMGVTLAVPILLGFAWKRFSALSGLASIIAGLVGWGFAYTGIILADGITLGAGFPLVAYILAAYLKPSSKEENTITNRVQGEI